eukprot:48996_1
MATKESNDAVWIVENAKRKSIESDYTILHEIGENYTTTYKCVRKSDGLQCAVKVIKKERIYKSNCGCHRIKQQPLHALQNEVNIMRKLQHKYIIQLYDVYETRNELNIVMSLCKGGELFYRLKARRRYIEKDAKLIIKMLCESLFYLHENYNVAHLDITLDNILFNTESETSDLKLIDFSCSKIIPRGTRAKALCGTPYYTAPEVIRGHYSYSADIWSVGVVAYILIFGFPPFYVNPKKYNGVKETKEIYKLILKGFDPVVKKGYGAFFPRALQRKLSKTGMDFISSLLEKDISKRLTAQEALQHPWLTGCCMNIDLLGLSLLRFAVANTNLKYPLGLLYTRKCKELRPELMKHLCTIATLYDNELTYNNFKELFLRKCFQLKLTNSLIDIMFNALDINKCGYIPMRYLEIAYAFDQLICDDVRLSNGFTNLNNYSAVNVLTLKECMVGESDIIRLLELYKCDIKDEVDYEDVVKDIDIMYEYTHEVYHDGECLKRICADVAYGLHIDFRYDLNENLILLYGYINRMKMHIPDDICNLIGCFYDITKMNYVVSIQQ